MSQSTPPIAEKRKTTRKASSRPAKKASNVDMEILFKDEPNPYLQPVPPYIWIDHPQEAETLLGPVYVIRLGVGGAEEVELSIDKGAWQPCRLTSGYFWYDWKDIPQGKHTLVARMRTSDGRWYKTPPRKIDYPS